MQPSSKSNSFPTRQAVLQGAGIVLMLSFLVADQSHLLVHIYDWLKFGKNSLLVLF